MTPGKNEKRSIFGAIELATGRWIYHVVERATSAAFIEFLEQILDAYPRGAGHRDRARQRQHALQPGRRALAGRTRPRTLPPAARCPLLSSSQPGRARLGRHEAAPG